MSSEQAHVKALAKERAGLWAAWTSAEGRLAWSYLRPHWYRLSTLVVVAFTSSALEVLRMGFVLAFLGAAPFWVVGRLPAVASQQRFLLVAIIVVSAVAAGWDWWRRHVALDVQRDFIEALRADVCLTMLHRPLDWFTANPAGQASYLLNGQVQRFGSLVPMASEAAAAVLQGAAVVALMFWTSIPLTAMALSGSALLWVALRPLQRRIRALSVEVSVDSGRAAAKAEECAYAIKLIKSCRTEGYERDRYAVLARSLADKQVVLADLRNMAGGVTMIGFVGILGAAVWMAVSTAMLAGFGILLLRLYPCLSKLIEARTGLATMAGHLAAVAEFMVPILPTTSYARDEEDERFRVAAPSDAIATLDLGVFYSPDKPVLDGITLEIHRGQATALVGLTGSGKTTLLDTLAGLRYPQRGFLSVPSMHIGYVTQEPILLFGTVAENLAYPRRNHLFMFRSHHQKIPADRHVGQRGSALSGGQRQSVAVERLVLESPELCLLDEPTSGMDAETEAAWLDTILSLAKNRLLLMATHKLSLAARFDRILVLHGGRIVQDGTHEQLVKEEGLYQRLWRLQEIA